MPRQPEREPFTFEGFANPTTTPVPDVVFDRFLSRLGEAELKALLYIIRRTFGFKRDQDPISFNQFLRGITRRDGRVLDEGCGVRDRTTLSRALKSLETKGIIHSEKGVDERGENETTIYSLRFREDQPQGVVGNSYHPSRNNPPPVVGNSYPQQTVLQETVEQQTESKSLRHSSSEISPSNRIGKPKKMRGEPAAEPPQPIPPTRGFATAGTLLQSRYQPTAVAQRTQPERTSNPIAVAPTQRRLHNARTRPAQGQTPEQQAIQVYIRNLRQRFTDFATERSSATRAYHLFERARRSQPSLDISTFTGFLEQAASVTADRGGELRYLFSVLESLLWPEEHRARRATGTAVPRRRRKTIGGPLVRVVDLPREPDETDGTDDLPEGAAMAPQSDSRVIPPVIRGNGLVRPKNLRKRGFGAALAREPDG